MELLKNKVLIVEDSQTIKTLLKRSFEYLSHIKFDYLESYADAHNILNIKSAREIFMCRT